MNRQYEQRARRELEALKRARDIKRELDEAARYKAALARIDELEAALCKIAGLKERDLEGYHDSFSVGYNAALERCRGLATFALKGDTT